MIITCPRCFETYNAPNRALSPVGRRVRCSACKFEWQETPLPKEAIAGLAPEPAAPSEAKQAPPPETLPPLKHVPAPRPQIKPVVVKQKSAWPATLGWSALVLISFLVFAWVFRAPIAGKSPFLADLYEDTGFPADSPYDWFRFAPEAPLRSESDGKTVFTIHGKVINVSHRTRDVPLLRIFWQGKDGAEGPSVEALASKSLLGPGESAEFNGKLIGVDARTGGEIKVTFASDSDSDEDRETPAPPPPSRHSAPEETH
jgi:predicted Zn finger-like uncharacterized protein